MTGISKWLKVSWWALPVALSLVVCLMMTGCGGTPAVPTDNTSNDNATSDTDGGNALQADPVSYKGTVEGSVSESQSTRGSSDTSSAQQLPPTYDTASTCIRFLDLEGEPLVDPQGDPLPEAQMQSDGSFSAGDLPVGVDFVVCADIGCDGTCDAESVVNIPADETGDAGTLDGVQADPLTTLALAKLRAMLEEEGVAPEDLPISPAAVIERIVEAYTHLFEESGVDQILTLEDITNLEQEMLAILFDELVPDGAQTGMQIVEGNLGVARAQDVNAMALGVAEVFLRAGFPVADHPEGLDLSSLANLEGIVQTTLDELYKDGEEPFKDEFVDFEFDETPYLEPAENDGPEFVIPVYVSEFAEPDRNFAMDDSGDYEDVPPLPVLNDYLLVEMAKLQVEQRSISLQDLYEVLTSVQEGLGARLTYNVFDPNFNGAPLTVFETLDGHGMAINLDDMFRSFHEAGHNQVDFDNWEQRKEDLRAWLVDILGDTKAPDYGYLFNSFAGYRIAGVADIATKVREAKAHLPFSLSGPSMFYVVADGDPYKSEEEVKPITVNADVSVNGEIFSVSYNPTGDGAFFLLFTNRTETEGIVELLVRETSKPFHGPRGPVQVSMNDANIFQPVDGVPFMEFVSDRGNFYPGTDVSVIRSDFVPDVSAGSFAVAEFDAEALTEEGGPNDRIYVLAHEPGGEPVHVSYDASTGVATYNEGGRHLLMFQPDSEQTGMFALFNEDTGRVAGDMDPNQFFEGPMDRPEELDDIWNNVDDFDDLLDGFDNVGDGVDALIDRLPIVNPVPCDPDSGEPCEPIDVLPPPEDNAPPPPNDDPAHQDPIDNTNPDPVTNPTDPADPNNTTNPDPVDPAQVAEDTTTDQTTDEPVDTTTDEPVDGTGDDTDADKGEPEDNGADPYTEFDDNGFVPSPEEFDPNGNIVMVHVAEVVGLNVVQETFTHVFGTDVANLHYNPEGDPYYDDINDNGVHDADEPTAQFRPTLFDVNDWRSTDVRLYYRRSDNNGSITFEEIDWEAGTPMTLDGVPLVERLYKPRPNAWRFGRPNTAINLLTAFMPPDFWDGKASLTSETHVDIFMAVALVNLVMEQVFNIDAEVDVDGLGPMPKRMLLMDAYIFVPPLDDPFLMVIDGFRERSQPAGN